MTSLEQQNGLSAKQAYVIAVSAAAQMIDFLDFFLISFVLAYVAKPWHLTTAQSTVVLLSSGAGAVLGSFTCGALSDRFGRRPVFLATITLFAAGTAALALTPEGSWGYVALVRFVVGFGTTGVYAANIPLLQEFMPPRRRGLASGMVATFIPVGILLGSLLVALAGDRLGWRGLFIVGAVPAVPLLLAAVAIPESPLWLRNRGRREAARRSTAWALGVPVEQVAATAITATAPRAVGIAELFAHPRSLAVSWVGVLGAQTAYYGLTLWAPVLLVLVLDVTPARAAFLLIFANLGDICGRLFFSWLSEAAGRRPVGIVQGLAGAAMLAATACSANTFVQGVPVFWLLLIASYFVISGGFAVTVPYAAEVWPSRLRASGLGSAYGVGSLGKIIGPLGLGLFLQSADVLSPAASRETLVPGFLYLGAWLLATGLVFALWAFETRGKSFEAIEEEITKLSNVATTPDAVAEGD